MADAGLLIGWNRVVPGKDAVAVELWAEMMTYMRSLHASGHITSFEPVLLGAYGGSLNGFVLLRGTQEMLDNVRNSDEFLVFNVRANKVLEGFLVVRAHFGAEVARIFQLYASN
jgi:hypothetical protein